MKHFLFLLPILLSSSIAVNGQMSGSAVLSVPTVAEVGAERLPADIALVKAPFPMPVFQKPVFRPLTVD